MSLKASFQASFSNKPVFLAILVGILLFPALFQLGSWALQDYDEATFARMLQESREEGVFFLTHRMFGEHDFHKPPFHFWLMSISVAFFGETEFAMRLPSALFTIVAVILVWLIVLDVTKDQLAATLSALVLLSMGFFVYAGRQVRLDVPVTTAILFAFYSFIRGLKNPRWFLGFGLGVALGVMIKSVVGLLAFPLIIIVSLIYKERRWLRDKFFWFGIGIMLLLVLPWHLYQYIKFGDQFLKFQIYNIFDRYTTNILPGDEPSRWYHFQRLFVEMEPWFAVFLAAGVLFFVYRSRLRQSSFGLTMLSSALFLLIIFFTAESRLIYYFVPSMPFIAVFIGIILSEFIKKTPLSLSIIILSILIAIGLTDTFFRIFSQKERDIFFRPLSIISRYELAEEEKIMGQFIAAERLPLYVYRWNFYQSLIYYGNLSDVYLLKDISQWPKQSFFLLMPIQNFNSPEIQAKFASTPDDKRIDVIYKGKAGVLLRTEVY